MDTPRCSGIGSLDPALLSIAKSAVFLVLVPNQLYSRREAEVKVTRSRTGTAKLSACISLCLITLCHLVALLVYDRQGTKVLVAAALDLSAVIAVSLLSSVAHKKSIRSPKLLLFYLLVTVCRDILAFPISSYRHFSGAHLLPWFIPVAAIIRFILLFLECNSKASILLPKYRNLSPEEKSNVLGATFYWRLNPFLAQGHKRMLHEADIPTLGKPLQAEGTGHGIRGSWESRSIPETKTTLLRVLAKSLRGAFASPIIPRLFLVLFRCAQPLIIQQSVRYVDNRTDENLCARYDLMLIATIAYIGLAIAGSVYQRRLRRLEVAMKSSLICLVYNKTLSISPNAANAGRAMTVMGTDVDIVSDTGDLFHEAWGQSLELIFGLIILANQVGWIWPVPIVIIGFCSQISKYVAKNIRPRQKNWNAATQQRIGALSAILGSMKSVKALGLTETLRKYVSDLRQNELAKAGDKRWMDCVYNSSANALGIFSPAMTVILFAIVSRRSGLSLDTEAAFTAVAALTVVTNPANMVMTIIPNFIGAYASIERLQEYLLDSPLSDERQLMDSAATTGTTNSVSLDNVTVHPPNGLHPVLEKIDLELKPKTVTVCCGPVGSGKSVLGSVILGGMPTSSGTVRVSSRSIGFCAQTAWLSSGTIRNIIGGYCLNIDEERYRAVTKACCLDEDIKALPDGDETQVGSSGVNLSGGQKQRLAIARMLYSGENIMVLDDSFAALDGTTEAQVIENLFANNGWLRSADVTVFWITNAAQHFHYADSVILLNDNTIAKRGTPKEMAVYVNEVKKFDVGRPDEKVAETQPTQRTKSQAKKDRENDLSRATGDFSLYKYYLSSAGVAAPSLAVLCTATYSFFNTIPTYWIMWWTESDGTSTVFYTVGYAIIALLAWASTSSTMICITLLMAARSGRVMHERLSKTIFGAPFSFFASTDIGVTLNRFSQDIDAVDKQLPNAFMRLTTQICKMIVQIIVLTLVQKPVILTLPLCVVVVYFVQKYYLRTSRQLRVMELEARSALYSGFYETVEGISTIRAFGWQEAAEKKNIVSVDTALAPYYLLTCLQRWLGLILQLIITAIAIGMVGVSLFGYGGGAQIGVALNVVFVTTSTLVGLVSSWTSIETSLGAVARLKEIEESTAQEDQPWEKTSPEGNWPARGNLTLEGFAAGYNAKHNIFSDMYLEVKSGQKLVICGRTGSGKSTIFLSLLRMIESSGTFEVDGVSILTVPRSLVRRKCFIAVPQDGVMFRDAPLRFNLDPTATVDDKHLRSALEKARLWQILSARSTGTTSELLDQDLSSLPPLSMGQNQLFAIARAIVQNCSYAAASGYSDDDDSYPDQSKPLLLLDEITSSMDSATENAVFEIIESEFIENGHTVIIISHRLGGLEGRLRPGVDSVAVLRDGKLTIENDLGKMI